jgi:voltage-gated sodium channel
MGKITSFLTSERVVNSVILFNTTCLFLDGFPSINSKTNGILGNVDVLCILYFIVEASLKIRNLGKAYFKRGWNVFDFSITILSTPGLIITLLPNLSIPWLSSASVLRAGRLLRFLRLLKFIPNSEHLLRGITRATKASVGVFLALGVLNITLALTATMLFSSISPENFGNPLKSSYSLLKMFTIEGWYEIPDTIAQEQPDQWLGTALRLYAIATVLIGGILGMGLANAVFIDEMTSDNTEGLEKKIDYLVSQIDDIQKKIEGIKSKPPL